MKKAFDCVEMMHRGAKKIHARTGKMTLEEQIVYWKERSRIFREQVEAKHSGRKSG